MRLLGRLAIALGVAWLAVLPDGVGVLAAAPEGDPDVALEQGVLAFRAGRVGAALGHWREADEGFAQRNDREGRLQALLRRAEVLQAQGLPRQALGELAICRSLMLQDTGSGPRLDLEELCSLPERRAGLAMLPALAAGLGRTCFSLGARREARTLLEASLELADEGHQPSVARAARFELARLYALEGDFLAARQELERLAKQAQAAGDQGTHTAALLELARVQLSLAREEEAGSDDVVPATAARRDLAVLLDRAATATQTVEDHRQRARLLVNHASLALDSLESGHPLDTASRQTVYKHLVEAHALSSHAVGGEQRLHSLISRELGRLYAHEGRTDEALQLTEQAIFVAQTFNSPVLLYPAYAQAGRLLRTRDLDRSIDAHRRAIEALEQVRSEVDSGHGAFTETAHIYLEYADALLARARTNSSLAAGARTQVIVDAVQEDRRSARAAVEAGRAAELQDFFLDDCVASLQARIRGIDTLTRDAAALYPIVFDKKLEILLSVHGRIEHATMPVGRAALEHEINAFRCAVDDEARADPELCGGYSGSKEDWDSVTRPAKKLYDWLVAPLEHHLSSAGDDAGAKVETLVFLPDGPLRNLPLASLFDGRQFLVQRFAIAIATSLELLDPRPLPEDGSALVAGLTKEVPGWDELAGVEAEVSAVGELAPQPEVLVGDHFTRSELEDALEQRAYSILHLATHAQFRGSVADNFLLTLDAGGRQPVRLTMNDLEKLVKTSEFRDVPIELLVLSACQTAAGDDRAALGLAGVGIKAGARSVLASLWNVHDEAAARFVPAFYRHLSRQRPDGRRASKAWALQQAQIEALARRELPYLWAPFVLIGSWL